VNNGSVRETFDAFSGVKRVNERSVSATELLRIVSRVTPLAIGMNLLLQVQEPYKFVFNPQTRDFPNL
jgi:hypothetical protein